MQREGSNHFGFGVGKWAIGTGGLNQDAVVRISLEGSPHHAGKPSPWSKRAQDTRENRRQVADKHEDQASDDRVEARFLDVDAVGAHYARAHVGGMRLPYGVGRSLNHRRRGSAGHHMAGRSPSATGEAR